MNIFYADDTVIFADSIEEVNLMENKVSERYGLEMNINITICIKRKKLNPY